MDEYINQALKEAQKSLKSDDVPIGAVIVENNKIIAKAHNTREKTKKITAHAEINAIEKACKKKQTWHLNDCVIYVTLEPCPMCLEAIKQARIKQIYYLAPQQKHNTLKTPKQTKITNIDKANQLLKTFFKNKRNIKNLNKTNNKHQIYNKNMI